MEFQLSYFKSYKIIPLKCCTQYASKFENSAVATRLGKISFHSSLKEGQCPKCSNYHTIDLFSHGGKVMLKGHQEQYVNEELPDVQAGFRKGRRSNCQHPLDLRKSKRFRKNIYFCFIDCVEAFDCEDHKLENSSRDGNTRLPYLPPEKPVCRSRQQLELSMEQQAGFKLGKEYVKAVYCHHFLFNLCAEYIMTNAGPNEAQAGIKIVGRNINNRRYADDTTLMAGSEEELKSLLMTVKEESEKAGLKLNIQNTKIQSHHFMANTWGNIGNSGRLCFSGLQN